MFHIFKELKFMSIYEKAVGFIERLERLFKARSKRHLLVIFLIFSVSGSASLFVSNFVIDWLNIEGLNNLQVMNWALKLMVMIFCYQFILLIVSFCFGEFKHFSRYTQRLLFFKISSNSKTEDQHGSI